VASGTKRRVGSQPGRRAVDNTPVLVTVPARPRERRRMSAAMELAIALGEPIPDDEEEVSRIAIPRTPAELAESTDASIVAIEEAFSRLEAMRQVMRGMEDDEDGEEQLVDPSEASSTYDVWRVLTQDLDDLFFVLQDGAVSAQLLRLLDLEDDALAESTAFSAASDILVNTAPIAVRLYPLLDRVATLLPGATRESVVRQLIEGELDTPVQYDDMEVQPPAYSVFGLLNILARRVERIQEDQSKPDARLSSAAAAWHL